MNHSFLDCHSDIDSLLSRLDPRVKIVCFLSFLILIGLAKPGCSWCFVFYALWIAVLTGVSRIPLTYFVKRTLVVLPFILFTSLFVLLAKPGNPVFQYQMGLLQISISQAGWILFQSVMIKGLLCVLCLVLLTATTPFPQLLAALESLKIPRLITMILSFMYRYIFLIEDEAMKIWRAMKSRHADGPRIVLLRALANMIGILFIRSFERGETVYLAMCSRGFDGTMRRRYSFAIKRRDWVFLLNFAAVLIGIQLLDNFLGK